MADIHTTLVTKLTEVEQQYVELEKQLSDPEIVCDHRKVRELSIKKSALEDLVVEFRKYQKMQQDISDNKELIAEGEDAEIVGMAEEENFQLEKDSISMMEDIANELVTADDKAVGAVILEVRAGAGGDEAGLWAGEILEKYEKYSKLHHWKFEMMEMSAGEHGGIKNAVISVTGQGVWQGLGYESGVHCVKRVPATETQGRVHTSTCTVAVLPEPEELNIEIPDSDVSIHVTTATGPGGQNVNKVATAVHMIHKPTGIEVRMQESKSQAQNREKAWMLLRARVYDKYQQEINAERANERAAMIGTGGRSERVRTYRWKESNVVDHRLNRAFGLQGIMEGKLDDLVEALIAEDRAKRLAAL